MQGQRSCFPPDREALNTPNPEKACMKPVVPRAGFAPGSASRATLRPFFRKQDQVIVLKVGRALPITPFDGTKQ
jgi:hypothetical protein